MSYGNPNTSVSGGPTSMNVTEAPPQRINDVLSETCKHLSAVLDMLDSIDAALDGPHPAAKDKCEAPVGVAGLAFDARRLAQIISDRVSAHLQRL